MQPQDTTMAPDAATPQERERCEELTKRALDLALEKIGYNQDAGAEISLAAAAWSVVMGEASTDVRLDMENYVVTDDGYELAPHLECICPPELLARGGFRGRCPVHG